jgi:hypothetical protein
MKTLGSVALLVAAIVILVMSMVGGEEKRKAAFEDYAMENGYRLLSEPKMAWTAGPFWLTDDDDTYYWADAENGDHVRYEIWMRVDWGYTFKVRRK